MGTYESQSFKVIEAVCGECVLTNIDDIEESFQGETRKDQREENACIKFCFRSAGFPAPSTSKRASCRGNVYCFGLQDIVNGFMSL